MSDADPTELRIYCLCGQKMRITRAMLGKPGKCVACRLKIRIPSEDELPPGERVLHLKEHPELLRSPNRDVIALPDPVSGAVSDAEGEDVLLAGEPAELAPIPFVLYEPLGKLCNYEHAIRTQLQALRDGKPAELDKATLMSYRGLARKTRQQLEKKIREELSAIAAELQGVREVLAAETSALRSGERDYLEYSRQSGPHRKRREALLFRQQNLRGWLATEDPHMAGGQTQVTLADVPMESADAPFPLAREIDCLPIEHAVIKLEQALRQREKADKRLNELHRMNLDGLLSVEDLKRLRADADAERERARTGVAYFRGRLQQVIQDCEEDSSAIQAHLDAKKRQLESGVITKGAFEVLEEASFRALVDIKRARNLATRALNANTVSDVPNPRGTFLERLARPGSDRGMGVDSWLAWLGSAMMLSAIFVPLGDDLPGGNAAVFQGLLLGIFVGASALGLCATVMARGSRALALSAMWLVLTAAGAAYFQYESDAVGLAGATLRSGAPWWTSLGGRLLLGGWSVAALSVIVALSTQVGLRWAGPVLVAVGTALAVFALTDYAGYLRAEPVLELPAMEPRTETGTYAVTIPLTNRGNRAFWVGGDRVNVPLSSSYVLERKVGEDTWADAGQPLGASVGGAAASPDLKKGLEVPPGAAAGLQHDLPAGTYRIRLTPQWSGGDALQHTFQLEPFAVDLEDFFPAEPAESAGASAPVATVELRGTIDGEQSQPKFSIILTLPDGTERREQFLLGDTLYGEWKISEFSPAHNTVTLSNGEKILIVERGKPETIQ